MRNTKWPGQWRAICQMCGFEFYSSDVRKRWDGLIVCDKDWETRHPQTLIKIRGETSVPSFVSAEPVDTFITTCSIEGQSAYADLATADCARADNTAYSYAFLVDLTRNGHGGL